MDITFKILAVILAGVAAYFWWQGYTDRAFAAAVFGAVSFFLSVRFQVRGRLDQREAERLEAEETEEDFDSEAPQLNEIPADEEIRRARQTTHDEQI
jgi:cellobiose-specific phosphotransferase system component IIC